MDRRSFNKILTNSVMVAGVMRDGNALSKSDPPASEESEFSPVANWPKLPEGWKFTSFLTGGGVAGIAADSRGRIYISHRGIHPIMYFDVDGNFQGTVGEEEIEPSVYYNLTLNPPEARNRRPYVHGLHVDPWDNVWMTDVGRHIAMKFSPKGELLLTLGTADHSGKLWNTFNQPTAALVAPSGEIYVADGYGNSRIVKFSPAGKFLASWGGPGTGPGEFHTPHALAMDPAGNLYVSDRENFRIQVFSPEGHYLSAWNIGAMDGIFITRQGEFYASSVDSHILRLDLKGHLLDSWDGPPGAELHAICLDRDGDLYVVDVTNGVPYKYRRRRT